TKRVVTDSSYHSPLTAHYSWSAVVKANSSLSAATRMRPLTAIGVTKRRTKLICSSGPPPAKISSPVSPLKACSRLLDSEPAVHTIGSDEPSVVVTIGAPRPWLLAPQTISIVGGSEAPMRRAPRVAPGKPTTLPVVLKIT